MIQVHRLIEECIIFNMSKEECMEALSKHANIKPVITSTGQLLFFNVLQVKKDTITLRSFYCIDPTYDQVGELNSFNWFKTNFMGKNRTIQDYNNYVRPII